MEKSNLQGHLDTGTQHNTFHCASSETTVGQTGKWQLTFLLSTLWNYTSACSSSLRDLAGKTPVIHGFSSQCCNVGDDISVLCMGTFPIFSLVYEYTMDSGVETYDANDAFPVLTGHRLTVTASLTIECLTWCHLSLI